MYIVRADIAALFKYRNYKGGKIMTKTKTLKIMDLKRRKNSLYGNPAWTICAIDEEGKCYYGKTASNALIGYELSWIDEGKTMELVYHFTKSGNLIFDRIIKK